MIYGVATAAYQIEGGGNLGGRTPCIWDEFAKGNGNVYKKHDGSIACDHYNLYKEDIKLMADLGVDSYRFSIAWPRIFPEKGVFNQEGMDYYIDLLKELKKYNIKASITLYHWDLPMWAHNDGGWLNRQCVDWFVEYSTACFKYLDKYAYSWITHNEPWCASFLSHTLGKHAPGNKSVEEGVIVAHHLLLSHGKVIDLYKNTLKLKNDIGITLSLIWQDSEVDTLENELARKNADGFNNRWFLEPLFHGEYPAYMLNLFANKMSDFSFIKDGDLKLISIDCDFIGMNYYTRGVVKYDSTNFLLGTKGFSPLNKTFMGWDITPESFIKTVEMVREYTNLPIIITENGSCWDDELNNDGTINDVNRVDYLRSHLNTIDEMNDNGLNIAGYYAWSFLDNYEWGYGYSKRFGIVYVDYETQKRYPKDSYYTYKEIIKKNKK